MQEQNNMLAKEVITFIVCMHAIHFSPKKFLLPDLPHQGSGMKYKVEAYLITWYFSIILK